MHIVAIKTEKVTPRSTTLVALLDRSLNKFPDGSILIITSKVVALCEGRFLSHDATLKEEAIIAEADYYLPKEHSRYGIPLTITDNAFIARAGIDASNTNGHYSLLPLDSYATARKIRQYLVKRFTVKQAGVIVVDSHSTPLRRVTLVVASGWIRFHVLNNYKNLPEIFSHHYTTHQNQVDGLAVTASLAMGEGNEQTPLCLITDIPFITFQASSPTPKELAIFKPPLKDDLFAPLLNLKQLKKGKKKN